MKNIVVLSGAGISAESGLNTFRDSGGLWEGYKIEEVASPEAFKSNPQLVLDFYNMRRRDAQKAQPNDAHRFFAGLEKDFKVDVITQNVDDLHERGGSTRVLHLHGELNKMRSSKNENLIYPIEGDIHLGDLADDGEQLRPYIVWFGEAVPMMDLAIPIIENADILVIIGTSLVVYPAASLIRFTKKEIPIFLIDKNIPKLHLPNLTCIEKVATEGVKALGDLLQNLS